MGYKDCTMKVIKSSQTIAIPEGVTFKSVKRVVTMKGARGTLKRSFRHLNLDIKSTPKHVTVTMFFGNHKQIAAIRTVCSHITNMFTGVMEGFNYKMKSVYAHFPINMVVSQDGGKIEIRNFLGEKSNKSLLAPKGVKISQTGTKDEIQIEGNDLELVAKCCAQIHQSCKVRDKDIRKFLDGVYVSQKGSHEI